MTERDEYAKDCDVVEDAMDVAIATIQARVHQETGDYASHYWNAERGEALRKLLHDYLDAERRCFAGSM